jgi:hypothetical protein
MENLKTNKPEAQKTVNEVSFEELQDYLNSPELVLPQPKRDLSKPENVRWLIRNIGMQNKDLPDKYLDALLELAGNDEFSQTMIKLWKKKV